MEWRPAVFGMLLALALEAGCAPEIRIERAASIAAIPDPECVSKALRSIESVVSVEEEYSEAEYAYAYRGEGFGGRLSFRDAGDAGATFLDSARFASGEPTDEEVETTRRMMKAVETRVAFFCRIPELGAGVPERCIGIDCGDAP